MGIDRILELEPEGANAGTEYRTPFLPGQAIPELCIRTLDLSRSRLGCFAWRNSCAGEGDDPDNLGSYEATGFVGLSQLAATPC